MKLADLKWAAGIFVSAALRPPGHEDCECHPKLGYRGPRSDGTGSGDFVPEGAGGIQPTRQRENANASLPSRR